MNKKPQLHEVVIPNSWEKKPQYYYEVLPNSWDEITLAQFQKLTSVIINEDGNMFDGMDNSISMMSKLLDISVDELEAMSMQDLAAMANKLNFMLTPPKEKATDLIKWKKVDEISYNDYVSYIQSGDKQLENLHVFIKNFSHTKLTEEEILRLPITEVINGFFLFRKELQKYLKASIRLTIFQVIKLYLKKKWKEFKKKMNL